MPCSHGTSKTIRKKFFHELNTLRIALYRAAARASRRIVGKFLIKLAYEV